MVSKYLGYTNWQQIKDLSPVIFCSCFAGFCAFLIGLILPWSDFVVAAIKFITFAITYLGVAIFIKLEAYLFTKDAVKMLAQKIRKNNTK